MKRTVINSFMLLGLVAALISFNACQKENLQDNQKSDNNTNAEVVDRAPTPLSLGVTLFSPGNPSQIVIFDDVTGAVIAQTLVFLNGTLAVENIKGICRVEDQYFITTGPNAVDVLNNALMKVNPQTGFAGFVSSSTQGTITDIDYNPLDGNIYGLVNNGNRMVTILNNGGNFDIYNPPVNITGIPAGFTCKGFTFTRDPGGSGLGQIVAATNTSATAAPRVFAIPVGGGAAAFLANINPVADLGGGHCGLGYNIEDFGVYINRRNGAFPTGANRFGWQVPLVNPTNSAFFGAAGFNFEDFSTELGN